jgi:hypothetical protein
VKLILNKNPKSFVARGSPIHEEERPLDTNVPYSKNKYVCTQAKLALFQMTCKSEEIYALCVSTIYCQFQ